MRISAALILFCCIAAIFSCGAVAMAQSPAGYSAYSATSGAISIPAGSSVTKVAQVSTTSPADGFPTSIMAYRAVVFATARSTNTSVTVFFPGPGESSAAVTIPANHTVPVLFETMIPVNYAGTPIQASMTLTAGAGGPVTIQPSTSLTLEGVPTYKSEREVVVKSRW